VYRLSAEHAIGIVDVVAGSTTVSFCQGGKLHTVRGVRAAPGYDLASGVGAVDARLFVYELAGQQAGPSSLGPAQGRVPAPTVVP
jgi:hypothetical protein